MRQGVQGAYALVQAHQTSSNLLEPQHHFRCSNYSTVQLSKCEILWLFEILGCYSYNSDVPNFYSTVHVLSSTGGKYPPPALFAPPHQA